jgi:hypothetical protein
LPSVEILDQEATSWRNGPQLPINIEYSAMVEDPLGKSFQKKNLFFVSAKKSNLNIFFYTGFYIFKISSDYYFKFINDEL